MIKLLQRNLVSDMNDNVHFHHDYRIQQQTCGSTKTRHPKPRNPNPPSSSHHRCWRGWCDFACGGAHKKTENDTKTLKKHRPLHIWCFDNMDEMKNKDTLVFQTRFEQNVERLQHVEKKRITVILSDVTEEGNSKTKEFSNNVCYTWTICLLLSENWHLKNAPPRTRLVSRKNCSKWVRGKLLVVQFSQNTCVFLFQPFWLQKHVFLFTQNLDMNTLTISLGFSS